MSAEKTLMERIMDFQLEQVNIIKNKEAYGYKYAPLDNILPIILPVLKKHMIGFVHHNEVNSEGKNVVVTTFFAFGAPSLDNLVCKTVIDDETKLAKMNKFMVIGSAITYFRRYHLVTVLGLTTDEDSDAGGKSSSGNGRSVQTSSKESKRTDFIGIFNNMVKTKPKKETEKTFNMYKTQMLPEEIAKIEPLIKAMK